MASQGPNNANNTEQHSDQAQMRRDEILNKLSDIPNQGQATHFLQETSKQVVNMAHGAADAVKNTLGLNNPTTDTTATTNTRMGGSIDPSSPKTRI